MPEVLIEASGLWKNYQMQHARIEVLQGAALKVCAGEVVAVVGRSGAGKSTLLHILGGLDRPEQGEVQLNGQNLYQLSAGKRCRLRSELLGFVFQSYHLLPELDVVENVMLPGMALASHGTRPELRRRAVELLERVGLGERTAHMPLELSGGEQQRAAIARALLTEPQIVLADEPTGNLDEQTGAAVLDSLFSLARERGHALVMVTHSHAMAARCDRTLSLEEGLLVPTSP
jgi:predicted ABC-type transport system involved in lysophospholipase L1 biosynthesis ATPase subunit